MDILRDVSPSELTGAALAYVGDAALELLVRRYLLGLRLTGSRRLNSLALRFVKATAQSEAVDRLLPLLSDEELYLYKRGRNAHGISAPKSATSQEYRRATGLEALFGALELSGQRARAEELFLAAFTPVIEALELELAELE